jgi:RNA polymerase sigma factor (sigma-70 family)
VEGRPLEDAELIGRAKDGDVGAYEELVRRYQGIAVRVAYLASRGADDAADAAQEAFVKAYRALPRFREGAPFRPWLLRIVANEASNRRRAAGRRERLAARLMEVEGHGAGDAAPSPEAAALDASQRRVLLDAVNGLRDEDRLALGYRFFLGFSDAETAAALGIPLGTVKSRVSRALRRLRMLLPPDDRDPAETVGHVREHRPGGGVGG